MPPSIPDPSVAAESEPNEVREAVRERYAAAALRSAGTLRPAPRAPGASNTANAIPLVDASATGCCAPSDGEGAARCAPGDGGEGAAPIDAVAAFYQGSDTGELPVSVTAAALGCGNPTAIAELRPGEAVLDLGSGGGIDCFLAAKQVGSGGHVIGVDMTDEMLDLARRNAERVGAANVEFRKGQIEAIPSDDASVDVIISNCVINLSTDKDAVLREAYRVLRPGGRFRVSDIVLTREMEVAEERFLAEWAGCIAGALHRDAFAAGLGAAGFQDVRLELGEAWRDGVHSAHISARKPG